MFIQFDIIKFYSSINGELLLKSLNHAREYTDITDAEPIGAYDSIQVADLIGIYILDTLSCIVNLEQMGLWGEQKDLWWGPQK